MPDRMKTTTVVATNQGQYGGHCKQCELPRDTLCPGLQLPHRVPEQCDAHWALDPLGRFKLNTDLLSRCVAIIKGAVWVNYVATGIGVVDVSSSLLIIDCVVALHSVLAYGCRTSSQMHSQAVSSSFKIWNSIGHWHLTSILTLRLEIPVTLHGPFKVNISSSEASGEKRVNSSLLQSPWMYRVP